MNQTIQQTNDQSIKQSNGLNKHQSWNQSIKQSEWIKQTPIAESINQTISWLIVCRSNNHNSQSINQHIITRQIFKSTVIEKSVQSIKLSTESRLPWHSAHSWKITWLTWTHQCDILYGLRITMIIASAKLNWSICKEHIVFIIYCLIVWLLVVVTLTDHRCRQLQSDSIFLSIA